MDDPFPAKLTLHKGINVSKTPGMSPHCWCTCVHGQWSWKSLQVFPQLHTPSIVLNYNEVLPLIIPAVRAKHQYPVGHYRLNGLLYVFTAAADPQTYGNAPLQWKQRAMITKHTRCSVLWFIQFWIYYKRHSSWDITFLNTELCPTTVL